jgi:hypothetical protein
LSQEGKELRKYIFSIKKDYLVKITVFQDNKAIYEDL